MEVLLTLLLLFLCSTAYSQHVFRSSAEINNVLIDGDKIFVASVDGLSLLSSSNLSVLHHIATGPLRDSPLCNYDGSSCLREAKLQQTHNHNKILTLDKDKNLLVCGSVRQGTCTILSSIDLSLISSGEVPVAANLPTASTVSMMIGDQLIVAASATTDSPYRDPFPAVAIREAPDFFVANYGSLEGEGAVYLRADYRLSSRLRYISMFKHQHFIYITAVESSNTKKSSFTTKLIRFCANDTRLVSYSEIELQCRTEDNKNYPIITSSVVQDDVLIASFADSSSTKSAICSFAIQRLKLTFWYNIDRCRSGTDSIGLPHIGRDTKCTNKSRVPLDEDTCELGVGGAIEDVGVAAAEFQTVVTALTVADPKIVIAGTSNGDVMLMRWKDSQLQTFRSETQVSGNVEVVQRLWVIGKFILVQLNNTLLPIALANCNQLTTCSSCVMAEDPLCQWCHSAGKCMTSTECPTVTVSICPMEAGPPVPSSASIDERRTIFLPLKHLPQPDGFTYECVFGSHLAAAKWNDNGVSCTSPQLDSMQSSGNKISLRTSTSHHSIVEHSFSFYDCRQHETCASCTTSKWNCQWCSLTSSCARQSTCKNNMTSSECVHIALSPKDPPLVLPFGRPSQLSIPLSHARSLQKTLSCRVEVDGRVFNSSASVTDNTVNCHSLEVESSTVSRNLTTRLSIYEKNHLIDFTKVTLYDCPSLAMDCSTCSALSPIWKCQWCGGRCSSGCPVTHLPPVCDRPQITQFHPVNGPLVGGTIVTIHGKDLGSSEEDIQDRVLIAGSRCPIVKYEISRKIVCRLEKGTGSGPVKISIGRAAKRTAESKEYFSFVDVQLVSLYPLFAPVSGGTKVTLYGQNLNAGSEVTVKIGQVPCEVLPRNSSSSLTCVLSKSPRAQKTTTVTLTVDNAMSVLENAFEFRPDPIVDVVRPLVSFRSGGRNVIVEGKNLDTVMNPKMYLLASTTPPFEIVSELSDCRLINSTRISCLTPKLLHSDKTDIPYGRYPIGFLMDNVTNVANLGHRLQLRVVPDPQFAPFKGIRIHQGDQPLILDGNYLSEAAQPSDYKIFIGRERCYVTLVDVKQLVCNAPEIQPLATDETGEVIHGGLPPVTIIVGKLRTQLGLIEYSSTLNTIKLWALVLCTMAALVVVFLMLVVLWKKRRHERERDYKKIQLQMEHLESNVRKECKQAFAELQTSISISGADEYGHADFHPYREYITRVLWSEGGPVVSPSLYSTTLPLTLAQFDALLSNRQFIFALVESAESDSCMTPSEKSVLSSLLISALLRNFHYCTEVVIDLLRAHIAKTVHAGQGNILFRKSESLVEKMVAKWLSVCLYDDVLVHQGDNLFRMYKALKYQTEKGPVDMITGNARYTINESKLLRESVDPATVDLLVMDLVSRGPYKITVNVCDTVTQVKYKVLDVVCKDTPFSQRPTVAQFDIVWQCPRRGDIFLCDTEQTRDSLKGPQKLKTVGDYGIVNGSLILMQCGQKDDSRHSVGDSGQCSWSSLDRSSSPIYSSTAYYHLTNTSRTIDKKRKIDDNIPSSIPEVYLTRLLTSKGTVQKFIEDFFESVIFLETCSYPPVLKFLFDLFDEEAARNGVDASMSHQWKSNCYILRFWANLINNPRLLFDIAPSISIDANLTVVAQTLADCFSLSEPVFGAHAPSSRLLFAKEVSRLRPLVADLFRRMSRQPPMTERTFHEHLDSVANNLGKSSSTAALSELLAWVRGNGLRLVEVMSLNSDCINQRLPQRLLQVVNLSMEQSTQDNIYCTISDDYA